MNKFLTWDEVKDVLSVGDIVNCEVLRHQSFGVFVDLGFHYEGLIEIVDFKDEGRMTPDEYPAIGTKISAIVLGFKEMGNQICLGVKPSQLES